VKELAYHAEHLADLRGSGINDDTIDLMGLHSVRPQDIPKELGCNPQRVESALAFPYPGLDFTRFKVFPAFRDKDGHKVKYLQKKYTGCHLYILPPVRDALENPLAPLRLVEGEKKAAAGVQAGLNCIGIGGLWNWVDGETGEAIVEIDGIAWVNRPVEIIPDSDVWTRPDLQRAVYALTRELEGRGAKVLVVVIPQQGKEKIGLDDYLMNFGITKFPGLDRISLKHPTFHQHAKWWRTWKAERERKQLEASLSKEISAAKDMGQEERHEATALLRRKDLLLKFLEDTERLGCVGEEDNKTALYLAFTSRLLGRPISINIKGESSGGKNFLVQGVGRFFPPESVQFISSATPKAFFYLPEDLSHKVVVIAEMLGGQDADYSIRTFQSEGEIVILVPEKDKGTGRIETKERRVKGPAAFIQTTTRTHLHQENETRSFDLFVDESERQTEMIFKAQNAEYRGEADAKDTCGVARVWQNAQRLLELLPVLIPYVDAIEFPTKPLRVRRDRLRFLALIEACALLHQYQRERSEMNGQRYIVASLDDYKIARELGVKILGPVLKGVTPRCEELVDAASSFQMEFTRTEIEEKLGWDRKTVTKYLKEAADIGAVDEIPQGKGKATQYQFVKKITDVSRPLLTRQEVEERLSNLSKGGEMAFGQVNQLKTQENRGVVQGVQG